MGARSSMDTRDAKLAMKGLSETGTYRFPQNRFPQINSSSTLFSDNRKERGVKMRWQRRRAEIESFRGEKRRTEENRSRTQCDIEQENARTCEAEELQNLQRTESARELHYSES